MRAKKLSDKRWEEVNYESKEVKWEEVKYEGKEGKWEKVTKAGKNIDKESEVYGKKRN